MAGTTYGNKLLCFSHNQSLGGGGGGGGGGGDSPVIVTKAGNAEL